MTLVLAVLDLANALVFALLLLSPLAFAFAFFFSLFLCRTPLPRSPTSMGSSLYLLIVNANRVLCVRLTAHANRE